MFKDEKVQKSILDQEHGDFCLQKTHPNPPSGEKINGDTLSQKKKELQPTMTMMLVMTGWCKQLRS